MFVRNIGSLDPRMAEAVLCCESLARVQDQQLVDQVLGLCGDIVPLGGRIIVLAFQDLIKDFVIVLRVERREAAEPIRRENKLKTHNYEILDAKLTKYR